MSSLKMNPPTYSIVAPAKGEVYICGTFAGRDVTGTIEEWENEVAKILSNVLRARAVQSAVDGIDQA